jgi:GNAT superfamily N-acetyltransferase
MNGPVTNETMSGGTGSADARVRQRGEYFLSLDPTHLNVDVIAAFFQRDSYWAQQRTREQVVRSIEGSRVCFGLFLGDPRLAGAEQVGFARVVSDGVTFAWLCDVFVVLEHRGNGLAKWLVAAIVEHPELAAVSMFLLATRDAHSLYDQYGDFETLQQPERWMRRRRRKA